MKATAIAKVTPTVEGNTAFALDLYQKLRTHEGNIFFSPFGISCALAMTYCGARGETARQMAGVLHISGDPSELHTDFEDLVTELDEIRKETAITLAMANSIWPHSGYPLIREFVKTIEKSYRTGIFSVDYELHRGEAAERINRWVEQTTNGKITNLISPDSLHELTRLLLVNAIYFKGTWQYQFDPTTTYDDPFHVSPDASVPVPMMRQTSQFGYAELAEAQLLELSYVGNRISMVVLLPQKMDGLLELERKLTPDLLSMWFKRLVSCKVETFLPRFRLERQLSLKETLTTMGMKDAFEHPKADFSGMTKDPMGLSLYEVLHKAYVVVNEEGTEAAAATAVFAMTLGRPPRIPTFRADHPFLFFIRARDTGSILFMGRVTNPEAKI